MPLSIEEMQLITPDSDFNYRVKKPDDAVYFEVIGSAFSDPGEDWCETVFYDAEKKEISRQRYLGY